MNKDPNDTSSDVELHESRGLSPQTISDLKTHVALLTEAQESTQKKQELLSRIVLGDGKPHEGIVWILEENRVALTNIGTQLEAIRADQKTLLGYDARIAAVEAHVREANAVHQVVADTVKKWLVGVLIAVTMAAIGFFMGHLDVNWVESKAATHTSVSDKISEVSAPSVIKTPIGVVNDDTNRTGRYIY